MVRQWDWMIAVGPFKWAKAILFYAVQFYAIPFYSVPFCSRHVSIFSELETLQLCFMKWFRNPISRRLLGLQSHEVTAGGTDCSDFLPAPSCWLASSWLGISSFQTALAIVQQQEPAELCQWAQPSRLYQVWPSVFLITSSKWSPDCIFLNILSSGTL